MLLKQKATERRSEGNMENVMVMKKRLLLIIAALVLALTVSSSVANTAHAVSQTYDNCTNPRIVHPEDCSTKYV
jgi:hypothetical protein